MKEITNKNILKLILDYFKTIGGGAHSEAVSFFTGKNFSAAQIQKLPNSCVVLQNKIPGKTGALGKQTHIHITGDSRLFFYNEAALKDVSSGIDRVTAVDVSLSNIEQLKDRSKTFLSLDVQPSTTLTKVSFRQNENEQVQISKTSKDGKDFMALRSALHVGDILVFLKYADSNDVSPHFFALGIPKEFFSKNFKLSPTHLRHLEDAGSISVKNALKKISDTIDDGVMLNRADDIEDSVYQELVNEAEPAESEAVYTAEKYTSSGKTSSSNRPSTDPSLGKSAIKQNGYKCIFATEDNPHDTFLKPNGSQYMEAHHIIPMAQQSQFENKLDTMSNLVPVCPLCHKKLHHGKKDDITELLAELFDSRKELLEKSGLAETKEHSPLTLELLKSFY